MWWQQFKKLTTSEQSVTGKVQRCFSSTKCYPSNKCGNPILSCFEGHIYVSSHRIS
jgi:hypothetical protein